MSGLNIPSDLDEKVKKATEFFWSTRNKQFKKQETSAVSDQGNRSAVTAGKQLDAFVELIKEILLENGVPKKCIFTSSNLELPGFYRPNKKWDLLVVHNKQLIITIEFKSQVGPSFGNNFNNRTEEAMGSALDIWTAYKEGVFGDNPPPWLGYFMVLEDCEKSSTPVKTKSHHFDILEEFNNASYKERYRIFCKKLLLERKYSAACFLTTKKDEEEKLVTFMDEALSINTFIRSMLAAILSHDFS
ncbi:Restriction endonuclease XhoI [Acetitomaculum ruminis DSM 5522]|uniref:Restriction endonuclease XhoI n=1 Tax=Acetitomaculum ruminis DSM 5522 TaxID=1120918 RepID=A0A1I0ZRZ4_9FIRM|nr:PaeR7I family type II restriction endonuclease [Acetitomaculum ruminis]SFB28307.1 Restriction endonuclease XhoI [Acetitomaculum ruminis DSM 5522]